MAIPVARRVEACRQITPALHQRQADQCLRAVQENTAFIEAEFVIETYFAQCHERFASSLFENVVRPAMPDNPRHRPVLNFATIMRIEPDERLFGQLMTMSAAIKLPTRRGGNKF